MNNVYDSGRKTQMNLFFHIFKRISVRNSPTRLEKIGHKSPKLINNYLDIFGSKKIGRKLLDDHKTGIERKTNNIQRKTND